MLDPSLPLFLNPLETLKKIFFFFFWLCRVFIVEQAFFSSCNKWGLRSSCSAQASHCSGSSCCGAWALMSTGFSTGGSGVLQQGLSSRGTWP